MSSVIGLKLNEQRRRLLRERTDWVSLERVPILKCYAREL